MGPFVEYATTHTSRPVQVLYSKELLKQPAKEFFLKNYHHSHRCHCRRHHHHKVSLDSLG